MLDPTTAAVDAFTASAILAALQVPLIASLPELYRRTRNPRYITARLYSIASTIIFLAVTFASAIYLIYEALLQNDALSALLFGGIVVGVIPVAAALLYASALKLSLHDADEGAELAKPGK